jgi:hypothetical protein
MARHSSPVTRETKAAEPTFLCFSHSEYIPTPPENPHFLPFGNMISSRHLLLIAMFALSTSTGCVHRRLTIDSVPGRALVMVDGEEVGYTPASVDFTYYGTREIKLIKDGYETMTVQQPVPPPWYQVPPLDFFSDNFAFGRIKDGRNFTYQLQPRVTGQAETEGLIDRAQSLRSESVLGGG